MQIVHSSRRGSRDIEHLGSAHNEAELEALKAAAARRLTRGQDELGLGLDAVVRTEGLLPNARLVVDHYHLVKLANDCVTKVRRRVIWEQKGRRGRQVDPAWANRRRLLRAREACRPRDSPQCGTR